jgi:hypothetical protein
MSNQQIEIYMADFERSSRNLLIQSVINNYSKYSTLELVNKFKNLFNFDLSQTIDPSTLEVDDLINLILMRFNLIIS